MRILWVSNAPWLKTGYGCQTAQVTRRLVNDGHEIAMLANAGLGGARVNWQTGIVLPPGVEQFSNDILAEHYFWWTREKPGWVISLYDAWTFDRDYIPATVRMASWTPVDHDPVPAVVENWAREHYTIAMSLFGQRKFAERGIDAVYVPHALEPVFHPTDALADGRRVREVLRIPEDAFLVMINAANKGSATIDRKSWSEMIQAFGHFSRKHPDAYIYVHTLKLDSGGFPIPFLMDACGIPADRVRWVDQYAYRSGDYGEDTLAAVYTAADVLLATSRGEGFGIPVIEAQACGTPVIVSDFSAQPELVGGGWKVPVQPLWNPHQSAWLGLPIIGHIVDALDEAYERKGDPALREQALAKAAEYDADLVFDRHWRPVLAELEAKLAETPEPVVPLNRAERRASRKVRRLAAG